MDGDGELEDSDTAQTRMRVASAAHARTYFGGLAAVVFMAILRQLPALAKAWLGQTDRSMSALVLKMAARHFSPVLVQHQMALLRELNPTGADDDDENGLRIRSLASTNEVWCTYTKDEIKVVLRLKLPAAYPFVPVDVAVASKSGVEEGRARRWLLTITAMVNAQHGSLGDALQGWRRSVEKMFDGVEECPICYSVLHAVNQSLPRMSCRTCKNKFHANCLYKWFNTGATASCPLCRSIF